MNWKGLTVLDHLHEYGIYDCNICIHTDTFSVVKISHLYDRLSFHGEYTAQERQYMPWLRAWSLVPGLKPSSNTL